MKLNEVLLSNKTVYHSSGILLKAFHSKPTWFSLNKKDALAWHENGKINHGKQITYVCECSGKIASEKEVSKFSKEIWPDEDFIYSMFDKSVGEFGNDEIDKFIELLINNGFVGSYLEDYNPRDFGGAKGVRSLVVFNGSKVKIVSVLKDDINKQNTPDKYEVGTTVSFTDDSASRRTGKIVQFLKKGTKTQKDWQDAVDYVDCLVVNVDGKDYFVPLYKFQKIKIVNQ